VTVKIAAVFGVLAGRMCCIDRTCNRECCGHKSEWPTMLKLSRTSLLHSTTATSSVNCCK